MGRQLAIALALWCCVATVAATQEEAWARAIHARDAQSIGRLLASQPNVNQPTIYGKTALMAGAASRDRKLVLALLARGARVDTSNHRGGTALMYAAWGGDLAIVTKLLEAGADPHVRAENGWTALGLAAVKGHADVVRTLLDAGVDPNIPDVYGWTPLMRAVQTGRELTVLELLDDEMLDLGRINGLGRTALHIAYISTHCELGSLLSKAGLDMEQRDFKGMRAADYHRIQCQA